MERRMALNLLLDFYGPLLTELRMKVLMLYCEEDLSLQEIADSLGVTRQSVHDAISKATAQLENYEQKLGMLGRYLKIRQLTGYALERLNKVVPEGGTDQALADAVSALNQIEWIEG